MANELTGGFDVVAEFSVAAVNRVLATMHRANRFQHSLSVRVDNTPNSKGSLPVVNMLGNALTSALSVSRVPTDRSPGSFASGAAATLARHLLDPIVNTGTLVPKGGFSLLKGVAQLQLGAPTISLPNDAISTATVHIPAMVRYFPDPNTTALPEFLHGEIEVTFEARKVSSPAGTFIHVDTAGPGGNIHFRQMGTLNLSAQQRAAINGALRNALITGFEPSSTPLPSGVVNMQFWALPGPGVIAMLMNIPGGQPPPGDLFSWNSVFLDSQDQFAIAVSADFISNAMVASINSHVVQDQVIKQTVTITVGVWPLSVSKTIHVTATISVGQASVEFQPGRIILEIPVHVHISDDTILTPTLDFQLTIRQAFSLVLNGGQVVIQLLTPEPEVDISASALDTLVGSVFGNIEGQIRSKAKTTFRNAWLQARAQIQQQVGSKLSAGTLQGFLRNLVSPMKPMNPFMPLPSKTLPSEAVNPTLTFTSVEIRPAGVVVHGALAVPPWPDAHVEFDLNPSTSSPQHSEYNALNSWIPGGRIHHYAWRYHGTALPPDAEKFVFSSASAPPTLAFLKSVCVTVHGSRIAPSGPAVMQPVTYQLCKGLTTSVAAFPERSLDGPRPEIAVIHPTLSGDFQIVGHASPWAPPGVSAGGTANLVVHFPDNKTLPHLDFLARAVEESGRADTATSIICVLTPEQLAAKKLKAGMTFSEDSASWERLFQVQQRPFTVVLGTSGEIVWRKAGALSSKELAAALAKNLSARFSARGYFGPKFLESSLRAGQLSPNFLFEYAPGRELTLRKLSGRDVVLVFLKGPSQPGLDTLRNLREAFAQPGAQAPALLAIQSGGNREFTKQLYAGSGLPVTVVADLKGEISAAYGVSVWPTTVFLDAHGVIRDIRCGLISGKPASGRKPFDA